MKTIRRLAELCSVMIILVASMPGSAADSVELMGAGTRAGWTFFGQGVMDSSYNSNTGEFLIDVDWRAATWGVGGMIELPAPVDGNNFEAIRIEVKTTAGSKTNAFGGIATLDDANLAIPRYNAIRVTDEWQSVDLALEKMKLDRPNATSRQFGAADWSKIRIVKILFTKPHEPEAASENIIIRNPRMVAKTGAAVAPPPASVESAAPPQAPTTTAQAPPSDTIPQETAVPEQQPATAVLPVTEAVPVVEEAPAAAVPAPTTIVEEQTQTPPPVAPTAAAPSPAPAAVAGEEDDLSAEEINANTLAEAQAGRDAGASAQERSAILLAGAGKCRDKGAYDYANALFDAAIQEDPENAIARRIYGDYLIGYRGLYELAAEQYRIAQELIDANPGLYDEQFRAAFHRSVRILHRDGTDGIPLIETPKLSLYLQPSYEFRKMSVNHEDHLAMFEELRKIQTFMGGLTIQDRNLEQLLVANGGVVSNVFEVIDTDPFGNPVTIFSLQNMNRQRRMAVVGGDFMTLSNNSTTQQTLSPHQINKRIAQRLPRRAVREEYSGELLLRFANPKAPYFRLAYSEIDLKPSNVRESNPTVEWEGDIDSLSILAGKNFMLSPFADLKVELKFSDSSSEMEDRLLRKTNPGVDSRMNFEDSDTVDADAVLSRYMGSNVLRLSAGGSWQDIERREQGGSHFDDHATRYRTTVRYSMFNPTGKWENPGRYRGRRSDHVEIGFQSYERYYSTAEVLHDVKPHISLERLGLLGGNLDLVCSANALFREYTRGMHAAFDAHQVGITPTWVFIYRLYDETFVKGIEHLSVGFPNTFTVDDKDGEFTRFTTSVKVENQWVTGSKIRIVPTLTVDYAYYPEMERDDWGIFAKCVLRY